jgi:RNA polymerase-binding transcription factor DksA
MYCKVCGVEVPQKRVEFLQKAGYSITCLEHSSTQKVVGFQVISGKTERAIEVCQPEVAAKLEHLSKRQGTGVSRGVKMDQTFKAKHFK